MDQLKGSTPVGLPAGSFSGTRPVVSGTETSIDSTVTYGGDSIDREFDERTETRVKSLEGGDLSTFVVTELETFESHRVDPLLAAGGDTSTPTQLTREMFASSYESTYDGTILDGLVNERSEYAYDAVSELSDQRLHVTEARYSITPGQTRRPTIQSRSFIFEATSIDIDAESGRYERATPERPIGETDNRRQLSTYDSTTSFAMGQAAGGSGSGLAGIDEFSSHQTDTVTFSELVALEEGQRFYELHDVRTGQAGSRLVDQGVAHVGPQGNSLTRSLDAESAQTYRSEEHIVGDVRVLIDSASIDSIDRRERQDEVSAPSPSGNGFVFQAIDLNDEIVTSGSSTFVRIQAATQNGHWADALRQDRRSGTITRSGIRRTQQSGGDQTGTEDYNEITVTSGPALPSRGSGNAYHGTTNLLVEWNGFIGTPLEIGTGTDANPSLTFTRFVVGPPEGADDARREDWTAVNGFGSGRDAGDWVVPWMDDFVSPPPPAGSGSDVKTGPDVDRTDWTWRPWWWEQAGGLPVAQLSDDQQRAEFDLETVTSWLLENSWVNVFDTDPANANGLPAAADGFAVEPADAPALGGSQTNGPGSSLTGLNGATAFGRGLLPPLSELGDVEHTCAVPDDDETGEGSNAGLVGEYVDVTDDGEDQSGNIWVGYIVRTESDELFVIRPVGERTYRLSLETVESIDRQTNTSEEWNKAFVSRFNEYQALYQDTLNSLIRMFRFQERYDNAWFWKRDEEDLIKAELLADKVRDNTERLTAIERAIGIDGPSAMSRLRRQDYEMSRSAEELEKIWTDLGIETADVVTSVTPGIGQGRAAVELWTGYDTFKDRDLDAVDQSFNVVAFVPFGALAKTSKLAKSSAKVAQKPAGNLSRGAEALRQAKETARRKIAAAKCKLTGDVCFTATTLVRLPNRAEAGMVGTGQETAYDSGQTAGVSPSATSVDSHDIATRPIESSYGTILLTGVGIAGAILITRDGRGPLTASSTRRPFTPTIV